MPHLALERMDLKIVCPSRTSDPDGLAHVGFSVPRTAHGHTDACAAI
jgi:hypothetical protein